MKIKEYQNKVLAWQEAKYRNLTRENSWLALAGLWWLNEGKNLVGSNPTCEVILPERAPGFFGIVAAEKKTVRLTVAAGIDAKVNGRSARKAILRSSTEAKPTFVTWNETLRMVLHDHAGQRAIRIWDNERRERFSLRPLKWFPVNEKFRIPAKYTRYKKSQLIDHPDTLGETVESRIDGYITFRFDRKSYKLDVSEGSDKRLFVKFRDGTSSRETYPPSRYLYTEKVKSSELMLDFNFAYSPPCAFTPYATCIFAPPQNTLPFRVEAGEIYRGSGNH